MGNLGAIKDSMSRECGYCGSGTDPEIMCKICWDSWPIHPESGLKVVAAKSVPVPFWRRVRLSLLFFGLICFLSGFAAGSAQAVPAGTVEYIIECKFTGTSGNSLAPCVTVGSNRYGPAMVRSYVIDPASSSYIDQLTTPFDYVLGGAFWAFGFAGVMILYFSSHVIGLVLKAVKNG